MGHKIKIELVLNIPMFLFVTIRQHNRPDQVDWSDNGETAHLNG